MRLTLALASCLLACRLLPARGEAEETRPRCWTDACHYQGDAVGEYIFKIDGFNGSVWWEWAAARYVKLQCAAGMSAAHPALPAFRPPLAPAPRVTLEACAPPGQAGTSDTSASWGGALETLGVQAPTRLDLRALPAGELGAAHFGGLGALRELRLQAAPGARVSLATDALRPLAALLALDAVDVVVPLASLPAALRVVALRGAMSTHVPMRWAARRVALARLTLAGAALWSARGLDGAASLRALSLRGDNITEWWETAPPRLENVTLGGVGAVPGWVGATALRSLVVEGAAGAELALPARWLAGQSALQELRLSRLGLRALPADMLEGCDALTDLYLDHNRLTNLPESLVWSLPALQSLSVTDNALASARWARGAVSLRRLLLDRNPLGDLCVDSQAESPLRALAELRELSLRQVGLTHTCADWRLQLTHLAVLRLQENNITTLQPWEVYWTRVRESSRWADTGASLPPARVLLQDNPLAELRYGRREYDLMHADNYSRVFDPQIRVGVVVTVEWEPECDCRVYWLARAARGEGGAARAVAPGVTLPGLRCRQGDAGDTRLTSLDTVDVTSLQCARAACPERCACAERPADHAGTVRARCLAAPPAGWDDHLILSAENVRLEAVPRLPRARRLYLAHNSIHNITAEDIPDTLEELDIRNNSLSWMSAATARRVVTSTAPTPGLRLSLWLSGNAWRCDCALAPALRLLHAHTDQIVDWSNVSCSDGTSWERARAALEACSGGGGERGAGGVWGAVGGGGGAVVVVAVVLSVALYPYRRHIKALLLRGAGAPTADSGSGSCEKEKEEEEVQGEEEYEYDVFLSYAHQDAAWAEGALAAALEAGGRRVCLHARDWLPGEWIPHQIATSVSRSRRTVALVSTWYRTSPWARAELRAALALPSRTPRLLAVLLDPPDPSGEDSGPPELAAHLAAATYLRRDDPAFWDKLHRALGPPCARPRLTPAPAPTNPDPDFAPQPTHHPL